MPTLSASRERLRRSDFGSREEVEELFANSVVVGQDWSYCGKCSHTLRTDSDTCDACGTKFVMKLVEQHAHAPEIENDSFSHLPHFANGRGSVDARSCMVL